MSKKPEPSPRDLLAQAQKALDKSEREMKALRAEQARREELENLPPEVLLQVRKLRKQGKFKQKIVKRVPKNVEWDTAELQCGHKANVMATLTEDGDSRECRECLETWLRQQARRKKK